MAIQEGDGWPVTLGARNVLAAIFVPDHADDGGVSSAARRLRQAELLEAVNRDVSLSTLTMRRMVLPTGMAPDMPFAANAAR